MIKKRIVLELLRWFVESGVVCFMIIALLTRLLGDELHWKDVCVKAIVFAVLFTVIRVKRKCGHDIKTHLGQHKKE